MEPSIVCRRRLSALLALKQRLITSSDPSVITFTKQFLESVKPESWKCALNHKNTAAAVCSICAEAFDQRTVMLKFVQHEQRCQELQRDKKNGEKEMTNKKNVEKSIEKNQNTKVSSSSATKQHRRGGGGGGGGGGDSSKNEKDAVLSEVRSLVRGLRDEALSVSRAVQKSGSNLEEKQHSLQHQLQETDEAAKRAKNAEQLAGTGAGRMGDAVINLCKKVMPAMMVETFVRPLVASLFQLLWLGAVVMTAVATVYLMIAAPKPR